MVAKHILILSLMFTVALWAQDRQQFPVKYLSAENVYLEGGRLDGLAIGDRLKIEQDQTTIAILHAAAARLPAVELVFPPSLIGRNTEESIQAGIMLGGVAMIDGLVQQLRGELGEDLRAIATGGLGSVFLPRLQTVEAVEPTLTLDGLRMIFHRCA